MTDKKKYTLADGPDVEDKDVVLPSGRALTDEVRTAILEETGVTPARIAAGRPALGAPGKHSPQVSFRMPEALHDVARRVAQERGITLSQLAREALEHSLSA